jgi:hypothetical protein
MQPFDPAAIYNEAKWWVAAIGFFVSIYKGFAWLKKSREEDFKQLQTGLDNVNNNVIALGGGLDRQTHTIVGELKEQRADFRTFFGVYFTPSVVAKAIKETVPPPPRRKKNE